eukprot:14906671-Ditylum_brightwellii.AAC.1
MHFDYTSQQMLHPSTISNAYACKVILDATIPFCATPENADDDLHSTHHLILHPGMQVKINIGISIHPSPLPQTI